jgi:hypothetical protein
VELKAADELFRKGQPAERGSIAHSEPPRSRSLLELRNLPASPSSSNLDQIFTSALVRVENSPLVQAKLL